MSWTKHQHKLFAQDIRDTWKGKPWTMLTEELREALVAEKALLIVLGQDDSKDSLRVEDIRQLAQGIRDALGDLGLPINDTHRAEALARRKEKRHATIRKIGTFRAWPPTGGAIDGTPILFMDLESKIQLSEDGKDKILDLKIGESTQVMDHLLGAGLALWRVERVS